MNDITRLAKKAAGGDKAAFDSIYRLTGKGVWYTCISLLKNEENAMDIMQDTYVTALEKLNTLENPASLQSWLNKVAANKCRNFLNSSSNRTSDGDDAEILENIPDDRFLPEEYVTDAAKRGIIMDIMENTLSEVQYRTIILYYFDEMTASEIAALMDCHEKTVLYRLKAARLRIKEEVTKYEKENDDKLYSAVPIAFLTRLLRAEAENIKPPHISAISGHFADSLKIPSESAAEAAKTGGKIMFKSLKSKIIAGVCAITVVGGAAAGIAVANSSNSRRASEIIVSDLTLPESDQPTYVAPAETDQPTKNSAPAGDDDTTKETLPDNIPLPVPGDYEYVEIEGGIRIVFYNGNDEYITVPSEIDGKKVLEMGDGEEGYFVFYDFGRPNNIKEITVSDGIVDLDYTIFAHLPELTTVRIPDSVTKIGECAFMDCASLKNVNIPEGEVNFNYTFNECVSLTDITLPESAENLYKTFADCTSLESIVIPKNAEILEYTFENCVSLKNVTFAGLNIAVTGAGTFKNCASLENIVIPDGVYEISEYTFSGCSKLKSITLPDTLEEIEEEAFMDCKSLAEITLPDGMYKISPDAFAGCENIKITYKGKIYDYEHINDLLSEVDK